VAEGTELRELAALVAELKVAAENLRAGATALGAGASEGRDAVAMDEGVGAARDASADAAPTVGEEVHP